MVPQFPGSGVNYNYTNDNVAGATVAPSNTPAGGAGVPGAAPVQWWNQAAGAQGGGAPLTPQAIAGMQQNIQPSLQGLGQLLGQKSTPNPSPQASPPPAAGATPPPAASSGPVYGQPVQQTPNPNYVPPVGVPRGANDQPLAQPKPATQKAGA